MTDNVTALFKDAASTPGPGTGTPAPAREPLPDQPGAPVPAWARSARALRAAITHERTRTAGRLAVRHALYVAGGTRIVARRAWDGRTAARYERMMRACEAAGQLEQAAEWEERGRAFRAARHQRRMDLITAPQKLAKNAAITAGLSAGGLLALGIVLVVANDDPSWILAPTAAVIELAGWVAFIVGVVWDPLVLAAPWLALGGLWAVGRHQQAAPQWALSARQRDSEGAPITPSVVVTALRNLRIPALRNAIRGAGAGMLGPIRIAGCGVEVDVTLPSGVSTDEVQKRRMKLAENLGRHEHEVFASIPKAARTVRLWIADSGALDEPIGPSPLVTDPGLTADLYTGRAQWGQDLRGDAAMLSLLQRHLLITGLSNQGKPPACAPWRCGLRSTRPSSSASPTSRASVTGGRSTAWRPCSSKAPPTSTSSPPRRSSRTRARWSSAWSSWSAPPPRTA